MMPFAVPKICQCGNRVAAGTRCPCQAHRKAAYDKQRPNSRARGYTRDWDKARASFLLDNPTCRRCCKPANVVDHIQAHKGNPVLFWSKANWQPLCAPCHNGWKQSQERQS
jgi:5-methylcytosine-specific restriction enzyme A